MVSTKIWRVRSERNFRQSLLLQQRNVNCYPGECHPRVTRVSAHGGREGLLRTLWHPERAAHRQNQGRLLHSHLVLIDPNTVSFLLIGFSRNRIMPISVRDELPGLLIVDGLVCARDRGGKQPPNRKLKTQYDLRP